MKKPLLIFSMVFLLLSTTIFSQTNIDAGTKNEVFRQSILVPATGNLSDPWEITYGADDSLWVTEAKGYKVKKIHPVSGNQRTVLDISRNSTFLPAAQQIYNCQYDLSVNNPQGGLMGLAIHPDFFKPVNPKRFIFVAYIYTYDSTKSSSGGVFYTNRLVRFTYNTTTNKFDSPMSLCDSLPGSSDHNSGRLIIAPVGDSMYLFYAQGDMGAGQFGNANRTNKAQNVNSYEGKILRFRINADGDANQYDRWIPSGPGTDSNFYNKPSKQSAVWAMGIRNNQGFVYANGKLYGSSHGPFTDDEINWLQSAKNYGHPIVIGDSTDANYDNAKAGGSASSLPLIVSEKTNARNLGAAYGNPIFEFYPAPKGTTGTVNTVQYIYSQFNSGNQDNTDWPSEGTSGMDFYGSSLIPGWKNSLLVGTLKGGKIIRLKLNAAGTGTLPNDNSSDTTSLFRSHNRFRDLAVSSDGKTIYTIIDSSSTTSGPTTNNPIISTCSGCLQKYEFVGYSPSGTFPNASFTTTMPTSISIAAGLPNQCENANTVVISAANNNNSIWVPITDTNSNIIAEIYANGVDLGTVTTSFYRNSGTVRKDGANRPYLDRNITITPQNQPPVGTNVGIRLYITNAEFTNLNSTAGSAIGGTINNMGIFKNGNNVCNSVLSGGAVSAVTTSAKNTFGGGGYFLQSNALNSFSTFYFASTTFSTLPVQMLSFTGELANNATLLNWTTSSEVNTANFEVERSTNGNNYEKIGTVAASGNTTIAMDYSYSDNDVNTLSYALIYYRLKIVDRDGNYAYSNIVSVSLSDVAGKVTVFPNPVADKATVSMGATADGKAQWKILDNAGRTVMQNSTQLKKGRNTMQINISKLSAGIYYLSVSGAGIDQKVKLQKL